MYISMTFILICLVLSIFGLVVILVLKEFLRFKRMINKFPGRKGHWLLGDLPEIPNESDKLFTVLRKYNNLFPTTYRLHATVHSAVVINTPEDAEVVLSNVRYIKKSLYYNHLQSWLKTGLLTSTGQKWSERRKLLNPAFHYNVLKKVSYDFVEYNDNLLEVLKEESKKDKTNIVPLISETALNIICRTSLGISLRNDVESKKYRAAIHKIGSIFTMRVTKQTLFLDCIFRFHSLFKVQKKCLNILHSFTNNIIKKRENNFNKNQLNTNTKNNLAMLDLLLTAKNKRGEIDDEGIREEVDTFTFEGHDTVSMGLSFALMLLANNQEYQKKIIEEIDNLFGDSDRKITIEDLQKMQYMEMCLKESLRLYPSVSNISRTAEEDIPLSDEFIIPKRAIVHISIYDIHHNPKYFPNPKKFDPDRFLPENAKNIHPFAYIPFSAGPRNCIGKKYAMLEMKSIIATIFRYFKVEPIDTPESIILCQDMVLRPKNGIYIKFVSREK